MQSPSDDFPRRSPLNPADAAKAMWIENFNKGPYTNSRMVEFLVTKIAKLHYADFLSNPKRIEKIKQKKLEKHTDFPFDALWNTKTGRCTAFALSTVDDLERSYDHDWDFKFYKLRNHRLARCEKTGVLIDSSSVPGAIVLREGKWERLEDQGWKYVNGKSKFEKRNGVVVRSYVTFSVLSRYDCATFTSSEARADHLEVAKRPDMLCLFRSFQSGRAQYHGLIRWDFSKKQLTLSETPDKHATKTVFIWSKNGTPHDEQECVKVLNGFINAHGGPWGFQQWHSGDIDGIHDRVWTAATKSWGYARVESR
ncbi:MAG: hypothetical protein Q9160_004994 [Pyrenula sp. 1 TL-2023]